MGQPAKDRGKDKSNTEILRVAQDDGEKQTKAKTDAGFSTLRVDHPSEQVRSPGTPVFPRNARNDAGWVYG